MNLIKLDAVRRHTRRELPPDQAKTLVSHPNISVVKAQATALSLHPWGNTPEEWAAARSLPCPDRGTSACPMS
jgi:hypothetical protein